jgi:cytochrome b561
VPSSSHVSTQVPSDAQRGTDRARYNHAIIAIHWLTALLIFCIIPIGLTMTAMPRTSPMRETWFTVHKSIGITILALVILRVIVRAMSRAPGYPGTIGRLEHITASTVQFLLYAIMVWMCLTGYINSLAGGHDFDWFFLFPVTGFVTHNRALANLAITLHVAGQWAVYTLISAHVLGAGFHLIVRRDRVLHRMLP